MKKHATAESDNDSPRAPKRKHSRRSPEGEAEGEIDEKWCKKFKVESGVNDDGEAQKHNKNESITSTSKSKSATEALRRRRLDSASATPTIAAGTPTTHDESSIIYLALKALAEVHLDDDTGFIPAAIKTFTEDHIHKTLPAPVVFRSKVPFVARKLRELGKDENKIRSVTQRLREAEAVVLASWIGSVLADSDLVEPVCGFLLDNMNSDGQRKMSKIRTPQPIVKDTLKSMPTPPSSSDRMSSASGADFDDQFHASFDEANRDQSARLLFPKAIDFFTHHVDRILQRSPFPSVTQPSVLELWSRLDDDQQGKWEHLLDKLHLKESATLMKEEAHKLLAEQFVQRTSLRAADDFGWSSEEADDSTPAESEQQQAAPTVEIVESVKPTTIDSFKRSPSETGHPGPMTDIPPPPVPAPPLNSSSTSNLFTRPTFVAFVPYDPQPNTYSVLLPINTPTCPISNATPSEVLQACLTTFGHQDGDASIEQANDHAWIVSFVNKYPSEHPSLLGRPLQLRDCHFQSEFLPRKRPNFFEADFSAALDIPTDDIVREVRWAFAAHDQRPRLAEQLALGRRMVLAYFVDAVDMCRFYIPFPRCRLAGSGEVFVACWKPMRLHARCWVCGVVHGGRCPRARGLEVV